jgi:hypothetical protein
VALERGVPEVAPFQGKRLIPVLAGLSVRDTPEFWAKVATAGVEVLLLNGSMFQQGDLCHPHHVP